MKVEDFDDLSRLDPDLAEKILQARIEAKSIIERLDPEHITGWADLMSKLEEAVDSAKNAREIVGYYRVNTPLA